MIFQKGVKVNAHWAEDDVVELTNLGMLDDPPSPRACCHRVLETVCLKNEDIRDIPFFLFGRNYGWAPRRVCLLCIQMSFGPVCWLSFDSLLSDVRETQLLAGSSVHRKDFHARATLISKQYGVYLDQCTGRTEQRQPCTGIQLRPYPDSLRPFESRVDLLCGVRTDPSLFDLWSCHPQRAGLWPLLSLQEISSIASRFDEHITPKQTVNVVAMLSLI